MNENQEILNQNLNFNEVHNLLRLDESDIFADLKLKSSQYSTST